MDGCLPHSGDHPSHASARRRMIIGRVPSPRLTPSEADYALRSRMDEIGSRTRRDLSFTTVPGMECQVRKIFRPPATNDAAAMRPCSRGAPRDPSRQSKGRRQLVHEFARLTAFNSSGVQRCGRWRHAGSPSSRIGPPVCPSDGLIARPNRARTSALTPEGDVKCPRDQCHGRQR